MPLSSQWAEGRSHQDAPAPRVPTMLAWLRGVSRLVPILSSLERCHSGQPTPMDAAFKDSRGGPVAGDKVLFLLAGTSTESPFSRGGVDPVSAENRPPESTLVLTADCLV